MKGKLIQLFKILQNFFDSVRRWLFLPHYKDIGSLFERIQQLFRPAAKVKISTVEDKLIFQFVSKVNKPLPLILDKNIIEVDPSKSKSNSDSWFKHRTWMVERIILLLIFIGCCVFYESVYQLWKYGMSLLCSAHHGTFEFLLTYHNLILVVYFFIIFFILFLVILFNFVAWKCEYNLLFYILTIIRVIIGGIIIFYIVDVFYGLYVLKTNYWNSLDNYHGIYNHGYFDGYYPDIIYHWSISERFAFFEKLLVSHNITAEFFTDSQILQITTYTPEEMQIIFEYFYIVQSKQFAACVQISQLSRPFFSLAQFSILLFGTYPVLYFLGF